MGTSTRTLVALTLALTLTGGCGGADAGRAGQAATREPAARPDSVPAAVDTAPAYLGYLRQDGRLVHLFRYQAGAWTGVENSAPVPRDWTAYGYDGWVRPMHVVAADSIPDDDYDFWGRRTDYRPDSAGGYYRPGLRVAIAATAPLRPYPVGWADSGSATWRELAPVSWAAFEAGEQRAIWKAFDESLCRGPRGSDCNPSIERPRHLAEGRLPRGHPLDSIERTQGKVTQFGIWGTEHLPGGFALYHTVIRRIYPPSNAASRYSADIVRGAQGFTIIHSEVVLDADPDGKGLSGVSPEAVLLLGGRVYLLADKWAWESSDPDVFVVTDTGFVPVARRGVTASRRAQVQDSIPWPPGNRLQATVRARVDSLGGGRFRMTYTVSNDSTSEQAGESFVVRTPAPATEVASPMLWSGDAAMVADSSAVHWHPVALERLLAPGAEQAGFSFVVPGLPEIVAYRLRGYVEPPEVGEGAPVASPLPLWADAAAGFTVGIGPVPRDVTPGWLLTRLSVLTGRACALGWIGDQGSCTRLGNAADQALQAVGQNDDDGARARLQDFLATLDGQHGVGLPVDDDAYGLLKANAEFILSHLPGGGGPPR